MKPDDILSGVTGNAAYAFLIRVVIAPMLSGVRRALGRSPVRPTEVWLNARSSTYASHYMTAFSSGEDVLLVSIMSDHSLKQFRDILPRCVATNTRLRALTLHRDTPEATIHALAGHLDEHRDEPGRCVSQVKNAARDWRSLEAQFSSHLSVREYQTIPTLQGIVVGGRYAVIEFLPFATHPNDRPAMVLTAKGDPDLFVLFRTRFESLWSYAK